VERARELLHRYLDEIASGEEVAELAALLAVRPDLADELAEAARNEARLESYFSERRAVTAALALTPIPSPEPRRIRATAVSAVLGKQDTADTAVARRKLVSRLPWKSIAAAVVLLAGGVLLGFWMGRSPRFGAVVSGQVLIDGVAVAQVPDDSPLEVGGDVDAVIRLPDGSHAALAPDSAVVLRQQGRKLVELDRGSGTFHVTKGRKEFKVSTPLGNISAHDADFRVELQPEDEEGEESMNCRAALLIVAALVGQVEVESGGQHYVLAAGQKQSFADNSKPVKRKPDFSGTISAVSGRTLTITAPPAKKGGEAIVKQFKLTDQTDYDYFGVGKEGRKPTIGYIARVWLADGNEGTVAKISLGQKETILDGVVATVAEDGRSFTFKQKLKGGKETEVSLKLAEGAKVVYQDAEKGDKPAAGYFFRAWVKPGTKDLVSGIIFSSKKIGKSSVTKTTKPPAKKPALSGTIKALARDGQSFTLELPPKMKGDQPTTIDIMLGKEAKITNGKSPARLAVGQSALVWLEEGAKNIARSVQVSDPAPVKPVKKKPAPPEEKKPIEPHKPKEPPKPLRDPGPTAALIDAEVDRLLATEKIPASPRCDDSEFIRRVSLDLTGRIPSLSRTQEFLASKDPGKRRKLIDELLASPAYGQHFATIWSNLIGPNQPTKGRIGSLPRWLADEFNDNRSWSGLVTDLLTASGPLDANPAGVFLMANADNFQPQPNIVAGSVARLFWGINLRCAECHNHPFAPWNQTDFWGTAAFFGKVRFSGFKGGVAATLMESDIPPAKGKTVGFVGASIRIPAEAGKSAGKYVKARFLGGEEPALDEKGPLRPKFAAWATSSENPFFGKAAVNRMWAHFFGRGFVQPLDGFDDSNPPTHPVLLDKLAREFASTGFDLKHLARCIVSSKAYQRTSRPAAGNESDKSLFSHMTVKVLTPEMFYDSLVVVTAMDKSDPLMMKSAVKGKKGGKGLPGRDEFVRYFRGAADSDPTEYVQGIPQLLRLMNSPLLNGGAPIINKLVNAESTQVEAIETLYLAALSRRPTAKETELMTSYLAKRKEARDGYAGVLWILLNSSEFAFNH
jgi:ferric-dicitrate binding protein FerR (iron transport regulator)